MAVNSDSVDIRTNLGIMDHLSCVEEEYFHNRSNHPGIAGSHTDHIKAIGCDYYILDLTSILVCQINVGQDNNPHIIQHIIQTIFFQESNPNYHILKDACFLAARLCMMESRAPQIYYRSVGSDNPSVFLVQTTSPVYCKLVGLDQY